MVRCVEAYDRPHHDHVRGYVDYLRDQGLKAVTCNKVLSCVKAMFRFGEQRGYVVEGASPARRVKLLKSDSEVHDAFLKWEDYERLKAQAGKKRSGMRPTRQHVLHLIGGGKADCSGIAPNG